MKKAVQTAVKKIEEKERAKAQKEKELIAKSMKEDKFSFEIIAKYAGLTIAEIERL